jgi:hypothetical protein
VTETSSKSPLEYFKRAVREANLEDRVHYLSHGNTYEFKAPAARGGFDPH